MRGSTSHHKNNLPVPLITCRPLWSPLLIVASTMIIVVESLLLILLEKLEDERERNMSHCWWIPQQRTFPWEPFQYQSTRVGWSRSSFNNDDILVSTLRYPLRTGLIFRDHNLTTDHLQEPLRSQITDRNGTTMGGIQTDLIEISLQGSTVFLVLGT